MTRNQLDPDSIDVFAGFRHGELTMHKDGPGLADPQAVGRLAYQMASSLYQGVATGDDGSPPRPIVAKCAGLLVYAMDGYGLDYEAVCDVADHAVAQVLAKITPDNRIPAPRRHLAQRSAIGQCDEFEQLVKLAEITCAARHLLATAGKVPSAQAGQIKDWADKQGHIVGAMRALSARGRMQSFVDEARRLLAEISRRYEPPRKETGRANAKSHEVQARRKAPAKGRADKPIVPDRGKVGDERKCRRPRRVGA